MDPDMGFTRPASSSDAIPGIPRGLGELAALRWTGFALEKQRSGDCQTDEPLPLGRHLSGCVWPDLFLLFDLLGVSLRVDDPGSKRNRTSFFFCEDSN